MALTKKKGQGGKRNECWGREAPRVIKSTSATSKNETETEDINDKERILTLEEITEARRRNLEKFEEVARIYGFVVNME